MPPLIAAAAAPAVEVMPDVSFAQTRTSFPPVKTVLLRMRASTVFAIVFSAAEPAPATLTPAPAPALSAAAMPIATASIRELDVAMRLTRPFDVSAEPSLAAAPAPDAAMPAPVPPPAAPVPAKLSVLIVPFDVAVTLIAPAGVARLPIVELTIRALVVWFRGEPLIVTAPISLTAKETPTARARPAPEPRPNAAASAPAVS